jgi:hypothetical protein
MSPIARLFVLAAFTICSACSGDDDEGTFAGVSRWQCYAYSTTGICDCHGLGPNDSLDVGGSDVTEISSCSGYETCASYRDDFGDWMCSCGPAGYTPPASSIEVASIAQCPP